MDVFDAIEELNARVDAHRDWLANLVLVLTYGRPELEMSVSASIMGTFVEGAEQQEMAAYQEELRALRDLVEPVLDARRAERVRSGGPEIPDA